MFFFNLIILINPFSPTSAKFNSSVVQIVLNAHSQAWTHKILTSSACVFNLRGFTFSLIVSKICKIYDEYFAFVLTLMHVKKKMTAAQCFELPTCRVNLDHLLEWIFIFLIPNQQYMRFKKKIFTNANATLISFIYSLSHRGSVVRHLNICVHMIHVFFLLKRR